MDTIRVTTAGSVDDGKSTLIGRLLHDTKSIFEDQLKEVEDASRRRGEAETNRGRLNNWQRPTPFPSALNAPTSIMDEKRRRARETVARGVSAWERDDYESALAAFEGVLEEHPYYADVHNKAGLCLAMLGRTEESLGHFDAALATNPAYAEAHLNRGIVLNELGRHHEAQEAFARAGELDQRDSRAFPSEVGNRLAVTHAQLGDLYLIADHPHDARREYEAALAIRPRFMDIRSKFAETLFELGEIDQAREELETILEDRPGFVGARVRLGVILHRVGDTEGAIREWQRCAADDPADMRARAYLASVGVTFPHVMKS